ncbi:MAG TPA: CapA family protein [Gemmatimonadales bacterium]|nr:CapA family protein [Gemmatimonadales bacterium]
MRSVLLPFAVAVPLVALAATAPARRGTVTICAGGDVMLGSNIPDRGGAPPERPGPSAAELELLVAPLRPLLAHANVVLLNVEGAIGSGPAPRKCALRSTNCWAFRQPVAAARALRSVAPHAAVVGNVANNHAMDAGEEGFRLTAQHLAEAGVFVTGNDTLPTIVPVRDGDTIAVLGFSTFQAGPDARDLAAVRRHVARAAARHRRVVVTVHNGAEGFGAQRTADRQELYLGEDRGNPVAFARTAVEAGALLVVGHGPHVLRAAEWRGDALVFYSLGNLLTNGPFSVREPNGRGAIACAELPDSGPVVSGRVWSTRQVRAGQLVADHEARAARLMDSLGRLDFPTSGARVGMDGAMARGR